MLNLCLYFSNMFGLKIRIKLQLLNNLCLALLLLFLISINIWFNIFKTTPCQTNKTFLCSMAKKKPVLPQCKEYCKQDKSFFKEATTYFRKFSIDAFELFPYAYIHKLHFGCVCLWTKTIELVQTSRDNWESPPKQLCQRFQRIQLH